MVVSRPVWCYTCHDIKRYKAEASVLWMKIKNIFTLYIQINFNLKKTQFVLKGSITCETADLWCLKMLSRHAAFQVLEQTQKEWFGRFVCFPNSLCWQQWQSHLILMNPSVFLMGLVHRVHLHYCVSHYSTPGFNFWTHTHILPKWLPSTLRAWPQSWSLTLSSLTGLK